MTIQDRSHGRQPMRVAHGHGALVRPRRGSAVAIGNFDGVHRGHQRVFDEARAAARSRGGESAVLTFEPHPARFLRPQLAPPRILTTERKLALIAAAGIDLCLVEPFDRDFAALSPESFVDQVLVAALGTFEVCVGHDFTFGRDRGGDTHRLVQLGAARGFGVTVVDPVSVEGIVCSSTKVREFVLEGRVDGAAMLLGREVEIEGEVVRGAGRGRGIGVPTANVRPATELVPRTGVYSGWAELPPADRRWDAAINIGHNPTFSDAAHGVPPITIEAHVIEHPDTDLYGARIRIGLVSRLRDEQRFPSVEGLIEQIRLDIESARRTGAARRRVAGMEAP